MLAGVMLTGTVMPMTASAKTGAEAESTSIKEDEFTGSWIWSSDEREAGQWMSLRKTFQLDKIPGKVEAKIAVDSKYWMWINGEMAIFEGAVKTGPNRTDMYYDKVDITKYLKKGKNTIAIQAVYFGRSGYGFKDSGKPGFLFDADFGEGALKEGTKIVSDTSWRVKKDPAYGKHNMGTNYRLAEPNIFYDSNKEMIGWQNPDFNDTKWEKASIQAEVGGAPFNKLWERPIPQLKVDEIVKFTSNGANDTGVWKVEDAGPSADDVFTPLSLPDAYNVKLEFMVEPTPSVPPQGSVTEVGSFGFSIKMKDKDNFYMPQVSMADLKGAGSLNYATYKPHLRLSGSWATPVQNDISAVISPEDRFNKKHVMEVEVDSTGFDTKVNGEAMERINNDQLHGGSIGFRNDHMEKTRIYSMEVTSKDGSKTLFKDNFQTDKVGKRLSQFAKIDGNKVPEIRKDKDGNNYLYQTDAIIMAGDVKFGDGIKKYTIRNATNLQGTPYLKVKSAEGKRIDMYTDTWLEPAGNGNSIRHAYITKDGVQEFEPLGWINGYDVYFEIPESVEVLELGFRPSTYNTTPAGSFTSEDQDLNTLYKKSYDTLLVTMRDNYMDCPDRERAQWWGDAVNEMQMAFYAMDSNAGLLYKKTLNQTLGWKNEAGQLPTTAPNGIDPISELPMQALAGVMSFWQYYMYSGDSQPMTDGYDSLINYLKLWSVDSEGFVNHRGGTWDWMDWGNNPDGRIIEQEWYYIALENVLNIAKTLNKPASDIEFLENRMYGIQLNFDKTFWNKERNAYYVKTDSQKADDRANALAIYSGLAPQKRHEDIAKLLETQMESSPYMEKYVLESLYMMDLDNEAMARTKTRYEEMINDEFPTLWEFWDKNAGTRNHAWTGGPLTMMYMFNAGITPLTPGYETFQIRPQTAGLKDINATIPSPKGDISVTIKETEDQIALGVNVPKDAKSADIFVPRLEGKQTKITLGGVTVYEGSKSAASLPIGVTYKDEEDDYVVFTVTPGDRQFVSSQDTVKEQEKYDVTANIQGKGTITVDGQNISNLPYQVQMNKDSKVTITATPEQGWKLKKIVGTYPQTIGSEETVNTFTKEYMVDKDLIFTAVFEKLPGERHFLSIDANGMEYAAKLFVDGVESTFPYYGMVAPEKEIVLEAEISAPKNFRLTGWDSESGTISGNTLTIKTGEEDISASLKIEDISTKLTGLNVITADKPEPPASWDKKNLVDGIRNSTESSNGFTTTIYKDKKDISDTPHNIVIDLGASKLINQILLYPRTNANAGYNLSCAFPEDFQISLSEDNLKFTPVRTIKDLDNPRFKAQVFNFAQQNARYIKITTTKLGEVATDEGSRSNFRLQLAEIEVYNNPLVDIPSKNELQKKLEEISILRKTDTYLLATKETQQVLDERYQQALLDYEAEEISADKIHEIIQLLTEAADGLQPMPKPITLRDYENGIAIFAEAGILPADVQLRVAVITQGKQAETVANAMKDVTENYTAFDITLWCKDGEISLGDNQVTAEMRVPADYDRNELALFYVSQTGEKTELDFSYTNSHKGYVKFQAGETGMFVLADKAGNGGDTTRFSRIEAEVYKDILLWDETTKIATITAYDNRDQIVDMTDAQVTYESSNVNVAAIDENGAIQAKNTGTAVIDVAVELEGIKVVQSIRITVNEPQLIAPEKAQATTNRITLKAIENYEYAIWKGTGNLEFKESPEFTELKPNTEYIFYQRQQANENHLSGKVSEAITITTDKDVMQGSISIKGAAKEGQTLTVETAAFADQDTGNLYYVWKRGSEVIANASGSSYKLTKADVGSKISVTVTSEKMAGIFTASLKDNVVSSEVAVSKVTLNKESLTIAKGKTDTLSVSIEPANATNKSLSFKSSDTSVASIDENGKVTANKSGKTTIIVTSANGVTDTCSITVTQDPENIKLNRSKMTLGVKESTSLKATVTPKDADNKKLTWKSSNKKVVTVNSKGKITAKKAGSATITVMTSNKISAKCVITVKKAPTGIKLNASKKTLKVGKTFNLKATPTKGSAGAVKFTSSNKKVAQVSTSGKIKAVKKGTATIQARTYNGKKAQIKITVK